MSEIGNGVFSWNSNVESVSLSEGITDIRDEAFRCCLSLTSVSLPESLRAIGNKAFNNCHRLQEINIPSALKSVGYNALENCFSISTLIIPESVTYIGAGAFIGCNNLFQIDFKAKIHNIVSVTFSAIVASRPFVTISEKCQQSSIIVFNRVKEF